MKVLRVFCRYACRPVVKLAALVTVMLMGYRNFIYWFDHAQFSEAILPVRPELVQATLTESTTRDTRFIKKWPTAYQLNETRFYTGRVSLEAIQYPLSDFVHLSETVLDDFVFVTAASRGFFSFSLDAIATVQRYFPDRKIIFYDLEQGDGSQKIVEAYCNVEYRQFPFSMFPGHISRLKTYAWKPLIIHMVLREYPGVFWLDSSARMLSGNMSSVYNFVQNTRGIMLFNFAGHNTFTVTHPRTYDFLTTNATKLIDVYQYEANFMIMYRTYEVYDDVIKWWVLCALTEACIAPISNTGCRIRDPKVFANCHRFDQSAINILLSNKYRFKHENFAAHLDNFEVIKRFSAHRERPVKCETTAIHTNITIHR